MPSYANSQDALRASEILTFYTHPDYAYAKEDWLMIRDALAGERRVKEKGQQYLPSIGDDGGTTYDDYKMRATFVNMTARTVSGLVGTVFRRPLRVIKSNKKFDEFLKSTSRDGMSINLFAKKTAYEIFSLGRIALLCDRDGTEDPYVTPYIAENIISWETAMIKGREVLVYVLLREITHTAKQAGKDDFDNKTTYYNNYNIPGQRLYEQYRVLILNDGVYQQLVYKPEEDGSAIDLTAKPDEIITPTKNGKPLDFLPIIIAGPLSATPEIQRAPVQDIVTINYAHYRTSAQLEHGRFFTAMPIYYVPTGSQDSQAEYLIGGSVVWETPLDSKPGILEYYGTGLSALQTSLIEKEEHISQLGGRIMGIRSNATAESELIFKMKQANEMSILLNVTESMNEAFTQVVQWLSWWMNMKIKPEVKLNQDFKSLQIASREMRAIALLYEKGVLPVQEVFRVLQDAEFIDEAVTLDEFVAMLDNKDNFPNQPDVEVRQDGYSDADAKLRDEMDQRQNAIDELKITEEAKGGDKQRTADAANKDKEIKAQKEAAAASQKAETARAKAEGTKIPGAESFSDGQKTIQMDRQKKQDAKRKELKKTKKDNK